MTNHPSSCCHGPLHRAPATPSGAWTHVLRIGGNHSRHHVDKRSTLGLCEHSQQALLRGVAFRTLFVMQGQTTSCEAQHTRASIRAVYMAFDEALLLESIDERAGACPIQCHPLRKRVLVNAGLVVQMNQDGNLQWDETNPFVHLRHRGKGNLVEATPKRDGGLCSEFAFCQRSGFGYLLKHKIIIIYLMIRLLTILTPELSSFLAGAESGGPDTV
jgi:hypothetical protein